MKTHPHFDSVLFDLRHKPKRWLVTGCAGFIGSHLIEHLLRLQQTVVGIDNFATGSRANLEDVRSRLSAEEWQRFHFTEGDICSPADCAKVCAGVDVLLHHAALGSVPRSIANPKATNDTNVGGFLNMLIAAKDAGIARVVFASSSSVYGDNADLPKIEEKIGQPLSPYAVSKATNELYAKVFAETYQMQIIGLRYFNVFGPRQKPDGPYAAVIPRWVLALMAGTEVTVNGDGSTSRDFCFVKNVVQMNLLAAKSTRPESLNRIYNTAFDARTSLTQLLKSLQQRLRQHIPDMPESAIVHTDRREGDILHSQASIQAGKTLLGYQPQYDIQAGLDETVAWYVETAQRGNKAP